jgi:serine/threonine-protein kinase
MAPEQAQGSRSVDHRSDIYSLGVILYNALSGSHPFEDESYPMLVVKILSQAPPPLKNLRPDLPDELVGLVARMLEKQPDLRPQTCAEVRDLLAPFRGITDVPVVAAAAKELPYAATQASGIRASESPSVDIPRAEGETRPMGTPEKWVEPQKTAPIPGASRRPLLLVAGIGAAVLGLAAVGVVASGVLDSAPETAAVAPEPVTPTPPPTEEGASEPPTTVGTGQAPAETPTVRVQITVRPADAELFLDGNRVANPLDVDLPQSSEPRRLEARREGYRTVVQDLVLSYGQRITIELDRGRGVDDRRRGERPSGSEMSPTSTAPPPTAMVEEPPPPTMADEPPPAMTEEEAPTMTGGFLDLRGLTMMK